MNDTRSIEIVYVAPARTAAWWASLLGAFAFVAFVTWVAWRMVANPIAALVVFTLAAVTPLLLGRGGPLRVRRVAVDHADRTIAIVHATGTLRVPFAQVSSVSHREELAGEGVTLDVVVITRDGAPPVRFGVVDHAAAEGTARALRAILSLPDPQPAQPSSPATTAESPSSP
jgi:anti-sigma-K factor RskA